MNKLLSFFLLISISISFHAQVKLNEASNANGTAFLQANGSTPDWIELFNSSANITNLQGLENFNKLRILFCDNNDIDDLSQFQLDNRVRESLTYLKSP